MNTFEVGKRLVELCQTGENRKAIEEWYADDAMKIEAMAMDPSQGRELHGKDALLKNADEFFDMFEVHGQHVDGPYPMDDRFICFMSIDVTGKPGPMGGAANGDEGSRGIHRS